MQLFDVFAESSFNAECYIALQQLYQYISSSARFLESSAVRKERWAELANEFEQGLQLLKDRAAPRTDGTISANSLFAALRRNLPKTTYYVHDVVTNQIPFTEQVQAELPGTNLSKGSSGLGWGGGAAIGVKLALDKYDISTKPALSAPKQKGQLVCMVSGDGSFIFGVPSAVYWAQHKLSTPFLTMYANCWLQNPVWHIG